MAISPALNSAMILQKWLCLCPCTSQLWSDPGCISLKESLLSCPLCSLPPNSAFFLLYPSLSVTHILTFMPEWHSFASPIRKLRFWKGISDGSSVADSQRLRVWAAAGTAELVRHCPAGWKLQGNQNDNNIIVFQIKTTTTKKLMSLIQKAREIEMGFY